MELNYVVDEVDAILRNINFQAADPILIGYDFRQNENYWTICVKIKKNNILDFSDLEDFLQHPAIKLQCLSIGVKHQKKKTRIYICFRVI